MFLRPSLGRGRSALLFTASPLGTALGGSPTTAPGSRETLGGSGFATGVIGSIGCVLLLVRGSNRSGIEKHPSPSRA
jgi:hypothetical protein